MEKEILAIDRKQWCISQDYKGEVLFAKVSGKQDRGNPPSNDTFEHAPDLAPA